MHSVYGADGMRPLGPALAREWVANKMAPDQRESTKYRTIEDRLPGMSHGMRCDVVEVERLFKC